MILGQCCLGQCCVTRKKTLDLILRGGVTVASITHSDIEMKPQTTCLQEAELYLSRFSSSYSTPVVPYALM